jgi:hypothetical protein
MHQEVEERAKFNVCTPQLRVMSYSVSAAHPGARRADGAGAQRSAPRNMVIRQGMMLTAIGVVIGTGGAVWLTRFRRAFYSG